jgi:hypothetical protein
MPEPAEKDAEGRFIDFINTVKATGKAWALKDAQGGLATWEFEETDASVIPLWSDEEQAKAGAQENFADYTPFVITLKALLGTYLPALEKQSKHVGINLSILMTGIDMPAGALAEKMEE